MLRPPLCVGCRPRKAGRPEEVTPWPTSGPDALINRSHPRADPSVGTTTLTMTLTPWVTVMNDFPLCYPSPGSHWGDKSQHGLACVSEGGPLPKCKTLLLGLHTPICVSPGFDTCRQVNLFSNTRGFCPWVRLPGAFRCYVSTGSFQKSHTLSDDGERIWRREKKGVSFNGYL